MFQILGNNTESDVLWRFLRVLNVTQRIYFYPIDEYISPYLQGIRRSGLVVFVEQFHAEVVRSISDTNFVTHLASTLEEQASIVLGLEQAGPETDENVMVDNDPFLIQQARNKALSVASTLAEVGLGGDQAKRTLAEVTRLLILAHVNSSHAGKWSSPSTIPLQLRSWVQDHLSEFILQILDALDGVFSSESDSGAESPVKYAYLMGFQRRALLDLGRLRVRELFDVIVDWDNDSKGAIEDLKWYITTTEARADLTSSFAGVISRRMLQPGASTTEILQVYIYIIRAFAVLDPKGVLLDRIARPIRRYLRDRDDTVRIIVGGLLADNADDSNSSEALVELAEELNKVTDIAANNEDDAYLDWDDMSWLPDPVDAGPGIHFAVILAGILLITFLTEYKKSKNSDVIGTLISLFETKDIFVKEFQNIMGERLLKADFDFDKEVRANVIILRPFAGSIVLQVFQIRVLELLKLRFGEAPLQGCEVMLKDVLDSRRIDALIHREQELSQPNVGITSPAIHTKILSRLFWPSLNTESFAIPPEISALQERYSLDFEKIKSSRKLTWLPALGQVTVQLELEDRRVEEVVQTWQASVIYAFQDDSADHRKTPVSRTVDEVAEKLEMDPSLVQNALTFWVGKLVLTQASPDTYTVLEKLLHTSSSMTSPAQAHLVAAAASASAASASAASAASAVRSEQEVNLERMNVFWQFIVGMLTNQGAMPLERIIMMLKFAVPGGFPFGNEELQGFLGRKVEEGKVEFVGGSYKIVKEKG